MEELALASTPYHIFSSLFILVMGLVFSVMFARKVNVPVEITIPLYFWHTLMMMVYVLYSLNNAADATTYYLDNVTDFSHLSLGTGIIELFVGFLRLLNLSYLGCSLVFNIFGSIGLLAFTGSLLSVTTNTKAHIKIFILILVALPSVSFWSAAIGKDSIAFMGTALTLWAALDLDKRKSLLFTGIFAMLLVRPHIAGLMIMALSGAILFDKNVDGKVKAVMGFISLSALAVIIPFALTYAGVGEGGLGEYIGKRKELDLRGGSTIDLTKMPLPVQMFTYVFRPLPHEAHSVTSLLASVDNMLLLFVCFYGFKNLKHKSLENAKANRKFMWFYFLGTLLVLSITTPNLGIAVRQKWMFIPMFLYLFISAIACDNQKPKVKKRLKNNIL
jgi:hypothetical protein